MLAAQKATSWAVLTVVLTDFLRAAQKGDSAFLKVELMVAMKAGKRVELKVHSMAESWAALTVYLSVVLMVCCLVEKLVAWKVWKLAGQRAELMVDPRVDQSEAHLRFPPRIEALCRQARL